MKVRNSITKPSPELEDLEQRVKAAQARHEPEIVDGGTNGRMLGMAWRLSTELVVAVLVGTGLGFGLDTLFSTKPWLTLVGVGFGFAAGIRNTLRVADKMDAQNAHIPLGEDIGFDDEDDV